MRILIIGLLILSNNTLWALDWGPTGHRATGEIAQMYLTKKAKAKIAKLLDGQSLALVSTYADEIKSDSTYWKYSPWHYVNFPFESTYEKHPKSEKGDIVVAIQQCVQILKDENQSKDDRIFYLKLLIHFLGDLHQPLHIGLADDKGGNTFQVRWFGEGTNLHWVWDEKIIDKYGMSYSELAANQQQLTKYEIQEIQRGTVKDWMYESREICMDVYQHTEVGENLRYEYMYRYKDVMRSQIQKGGIRLALLLNEIFG